MTKKYTCKKRGGERYNNPKLFPHDIKYQDIINNANNLTEIDPHNISNFAVNHVYYLHKNGNMNYSKYRVKDINSKNNTITIVPALAKGKKYGFVVPSVWNINKFDYAYLVDNDKLRRINTNTIRNVSMGSIASKTTTPAQKKTLGHPNISRHIESFLGGKTKHRRKKNNFRRKVKGKRTKRKKTI